MLALFFGYRWLPYYFDIKFGVFLLSVLQRLEVLCVCVSSCVPEITRSVAEMLAAMGLVNGFQGFQNYERYGGVACTEVEKPLSFQSK